MEKTYQGNGKMAGRITPIYFLNGFGWGMIGGLAGTLVMDLMLMGAFSAFRLPTLTCFSIVGNTVALFFSIQSMDMAGIIRLGVATHYLIGPLFGAIFGMLIARVVALRVNSMKKSILLSILYVEILSQPILAMTPIMLKMTLPATLQWYGGSFVMHLIMAIVLGGIVGYGVLGHTAPTKI